MKSKNRITRSNAAWRRFLLKSHLATEKDIATQQLLELKQRIDKWKKKRGPSPSGEDNTTSDKCPDDS